MKWLGGGGSLWNDVLRFCKKYTIIPILLCFIVIFSCGSKDFWGLENFANIINQNTIYGVSAVGMTFLIINGHYDLSVGMVMCLSANLAIGLQPYGLAAAVGAALLMGLGVGLVNGLLVSKVGMNAFITTLSTMYGVRGIIYIYSNEESMRGMIPALEIYGNWNFLGVPLLTWTFLACALAGSWVLRNTVHGRNTYASGGNPSAAANAGINVSRTVLINFIISGGTAALAGIMQAARLNSCSPTLGYPDFQMMVIACVVLGGSKLQGGYGGIFRTVGGVIAIGILQNGLNMLGFQTYYKTLAVGLVLIGIIALDRVISFEKGAAAAD